MVRPDSKNVGLGVEEALLGKAFWSPGQEWEFEGVVYRAERLKRRETLGDDWQRLFRMMEALAEQYGDGGVRLVVWFDA